MFTGWQAFHVENDLHATALRGDRSRTNVRTVRVFDLDARGSLGKGDRAGGQRLLRTRPLLFPESAYLSLDSRAALGQHGSHAAV